MMSRQTLIVFIVPIFFSLVFGYAVLADILQKPGRELDLWRLFSEFSGYGSETAGLPDRDSEQATLSKFAGISENGASAVKRGAS